MRFTEFKHLLMESRGLGARRSGDEFVSTTNPEDKIFVNTVTFYPVGAERFNSYEEMVAQLEEIKNSMPEATFNVIGKLSMKKLAFGVAIFDRPTSSLTDSDNPSVEKLVFIKPFEKLDLDPKANTWDNQKGIPGYNYNSASSAKAKSGLSPQDILVEIKNLGPQEIADQIAAKFGEDHALTKLANDMVQGTPLPITIPAPAGLSFAAFRDYFCELLHPIALITGNYTGNAAEAAKVFLDTDDFSSTVINFNNDKTEKLVDSRLATPEGRQIKISSKGGAGASASVSGLADAAKSLSASNSDLMKDSKVTEVIDLITGLLEAGQHNAPLLLGVKYEIISNEDADSIRSWRRKGLIDLADIDQISMSDNLKAVIASRRTKTPKATNLYYHALAAVAHLAADKVNEKTNFSQVASSILNNSALIQIHTTASEKQGQWTLQEFHSKWPSKAVTGVQFSAKKPYSSTECKGNFTFKILTNGVTPIEDESDQIDLAVDKAQPAVAAPVELPVPVTTKKTAPRITTATKPTAPRMTLRKKR